MKTAYIAGKVSGLSIDEVRAKFAAKQEQLEAKGFSVFNPVEEVINQGYSAENYNMIMGYCLREMTDCDEIHLLPCWRESKGARIEQYVATALRMKIVYP